MTFDLPSLLRDNTLSNYTKLSHYGMLQLVRDNNVVKNCVIKETSSLLIEASVQHNTLRAHSNTPIIVQT